MHGLGWLRELPDPRDWVIDEHPQGSLLFNRPLFPGTTQGPLSTPTAVPASMDLTKWCSPIEDQGNLGSCTAQATVGLVEYLERRARGQHIDGSRLFVYKMARQLDGFTGDTGAYVRSAIKALRVFGAPPERYWPYNISKFDLDPPAFSFAYGQSFRAIRYFRLDRAGRRPADLLSMIKSMIAAALPVVFGYLVYSWGNSRGEFPMPDRNADPYGGHAVLAVGYDDAREIEGYRGALKIRNSWGTGWGERGYGWLPYGYVLDRLSSDFWVVYRQDYLID
jgi:C1A family cysteine protease